MKKCKEAQMFEQFLADENALRLRYEVIDELENSIDKLDEQIDEADSCGLDEVADALSRVRNDLNSEKLEHELVANELERNLLDFELFQNYRK